MTKITRLKSLGLTFSLLVAGVIFGILPLGKLIAADPTDATLSNLTVSTGQLSPSFKSGTFIYTMEVSYGVESIKLTPTATQEDATITVDGVPVESGTASGDIVLDGGGKEKLILVQVTSQDESKSLTYKVSVTRNLPALSSLADLQVAYGETNFLISPDFNPDVFEYVGAYDEETSEFPASVTSVWVTPILWDHPGYEGASFTVNGNVPEEGSSSVEVVLNPGENLIEVVVIGPDESSSTYTLTLNRAVSTDATLSFLGVFEENSEENLVKDFDPINTTVYVVNNLIAAKDKGIFLHAIPKGVNATLQVLKGSVEIDPVEGGDGIYNVAPLDAGVQTTITVKVTAEDGTVKSYTVAITRTANDDADLNQFLVEDTEAGIEFKYDEIENSYQGTYSMPYALWSQGVVSIGAKLSDANATYIVSESDGEGGYVNLSDGIWDVSSYSSESAPNIRVTVTSENGEIVQIYDITVSFVVTASTDSSLSALALSDGTLAPDFDAGTKAYTAAVANSVSSITVTPTATDAKATITVDDVTVVSGEASEAISLVVGDNTITVVVTAEDGTTISTYTITVTRAASSDSSLSALALSQGTLDPVFAAGTKAYTASVGNSVSNITVTPTAADATSTITVNGEAVLSAEASEAISLAVGDNTITVVVTAEDESTTTYTITVTREEAAPEVKDYSGTYFIKSLNSGLVMDVYGGGRDNGANIIQWAKHGGLNQQWKFTATGDGYYTITSVLNPQYSLDVFGGGSSIGQRVIQYTSLPHQINQKWKIIENDGGTITLQSQLAETNGTGYVLDVFGGGKTAGVNVIQWTNTGGDNQKWILEAVQD